MSADTPPAPSPDIPPERPGPPPLRIHHILVATAVVAVQLTLGKFLLENSPPGMDSFLQSATGIMNMVSSGLSLTLAGFGIAWRYGGRRFFDQPGHWIVLLQLFNLLFFATLFIGWLFRSEDGLQYAPISSAIYGILLFLGWPIVNFIAAWIGFDSGWWRWFFILQGTSYFVIIVTSQFLSAPSGYWFTFYSFLFVLLIAAVLTDLRASRTRDWPHWVGVLTAAAAQALGIAVGF